MDLLEGWMRQGGSPLPELGVGVTYTSSIEPLLQQHRVGLFDVVKVEPQTTWLQTSDHWQDAVDEQRHSPDYRLTEASYIAAFGATGARLDRRDWPRWDTRLMQLRTGVLESIMHDSAVLVSRRRHAVPITGEEMHDLRFATQVSDDE